jgi:segregation and condensation protein B
LKDSFALTTCYLAMENIKHIIESLLFVADEPLTVDRIKTVLDQADSKEIKNAIAEITADYDARHGGFFLDEVAGGYQIRTRPEYTEWIKKLIQPKPQRLSKAALETLVIIAYKQPVIRSDIEYLRGVDCGGVLRALLERKLIRVLGRKEIAGRPLIYATTKRFLEVFDLKNLKDLPTPKEIEELGASEASDGAAGFSDIISDTVTTEENREDSEEAVQEIEESTVSSPALSASSETPQDTLRESRGGEESDMSENPDNV